MYGYPGKNTFNNYQYSHNQLSADNPFRFIGSTYNPYQPKISNQPSQNYEVEIANNSQKKMPLSPYERKSYNNSNNDINDNRPWLINNSYNIINNIPYSKNPNFNYSLKPQQRDHVAELFNYTNRDLQNLYLNNNNKTDDLKINTKNENINQSPLNIYNDIKSSRTPPKMNSLINNKENINEFSPNNIQNINKDKDNNKDNNIFNPKNNEDQYSNNKKNDNNYDNKINSLLINSNEKNKNENEKYNNQNLYNNNNNYNNYKNYNNNNYNNDNNNFNNNKNSNTEEKLSNIDLSEYSEENCSSIKSYAYKENPNKPYRNYMEDKGRAIQNINGDPNSSLFCLFDGHGGDEVSKYLQSNFYTYFKESLPFDNVKENLIILFKK